MRTNGAPWWDSGSARLQQTTMQSARYVTVPHSRSEPFLSRFWEICPIWPETARFSKCAHMVGETLWQGGQGSSEGVNVGGQGFLGVA
jgi:hypothetical protein